MAKRKKKAVRRGRAVKKGVPPSVAPQGPSGVEDEESVPDLVAEYVERAAPPPLPARVRGRRPTLSCVVPPPPFRKLQAKTRELIAMQGSHPDADLIEDIIMTGLKLIRDGAPRNELRILQAAVRELRYAFKIYRGYADRRKLTVFGSARTPKKAPEYKQAWRFSKEMVKRGFMVITGAGGGIMEAAQGGAGKENSFGMNIRLPFEQSANPYINNDRKLVYFRYFFTRKLCFVKEASAIALFPGGFGTMDECFETLTLIQTGKASLIPIVFIDKKGGHYWRKWADYIAGHLLGNGLISADDLDLFKITDDPMWAAEEVSNFYRRFHSSRYVGETLVVRMNSPLPAAVVADLNEHFSGILTEGGKIEASDALPEEADQPELKGLPRLKIPFNRRDHGRLRQLIDEVNRASGFGRRKAQG
jgi:uncharacterized protein (TIGR00730 family)